jgi:hypothetical protein
MPVYPRAPISFDFRFYREINVVSFLVLRFLHGVRGEFTEDVSETAVGPIFTYL